MPPPAPRPASGPSPASSSPSPTTRTPGIRPVAYRSNQHPAGRIRARERTSRPVGAASGPASGLNASGDHVSTTFDTWAPRARAAPCPAIGLVSGSAPIRGATARFLRGDQLVHAGRPSGIYSASAGSGDVRAGTNWIRMVACPQACIASSTRPRMRVSNQCRSRVLGTQT